MRGRGRGLRRLAAAAGFVAAAAVAGAVLAAAFARPVAVAAAGDRVVAAVRLLGTNWLVPVAPRAVWLLRLPDGQDPLLLAGTGGGGLAAVSGGQARLFAWPDGPPRARPRAAAAGAVGPDPARRALAADVDGDGAAELLLLRGDPPTMAESRPGLAGRVEVWKAEGGSLHLAWQGFEKYAPWQLAAGDVDGDGSTEWAAGVWTRAVYDPRWAERPWLYRWKNGQPYAAWLGSRLAHPFSDFAVAPLEAGASARLVAVEAARDGGQTLSAYRWNGFGFTLEHPGPAWPGVAAFTALSPAPGCAALAAAVEPEPGGASAQARAPALVLLDLAPTPDGSLREVARHPLPAPAGSPPQMAAVPGRVWVLSGGRLSSFDTCSVARQGSTP